MKIRFIFLLIPVLAVSCSHKYNSDELDLGFYQWNIWPDSQPGADGLPSCGWEVLHRGIGELVRIPALVEEHYPAEELSGTTWFHCRFTLPEIWEDRQISLKFEGISHSAGIYLNEVPVGSYPGGDSAFSLDITETIYYVRDNHLAVRISDPEQVSGGISGKVWISSLDPVQEAKTQPNIIFILADDLSYRDLSCYGQELYGTPHLDRLANKGVRFTQAYVAAPECAPSRGCLMTGLHTGHGPIRVNSSARGQEYLRDSDITIAEVLKKAGYATGFTGKWGIGLPDSEGVPYKQGFDYAFGFYDQGRAHTYYPEFLWENEVKIEYPENVGFDMPKRYRISVPEPDPDDLNMYDENGDIVISELKDPQGGTFSAGEIDRAAMEFVKEHAKVPFFLYYAPQIPHGPVIMDNFGEMQQLTGIPQPNREWAAMVMRLDRFVGELVEELKLLGAYDNTIIFFASDNGYAQCGYLGRGNGPYWPDDPWFKNKGPFTGGKFSVLEGGNRVPFFVTWEAEFGPAVVNEPVWLNDFYPTAAGLAGIAFEHHVDGCDLWPALTGNMDQFDSHEYLYFSKNREQAVRMGSWKAYRKSPDDSIRLYLVDEDTYGERDLSSNYPDVAEKAKAIMDTSFTSHEWYWTPDESRAEFQKKIDKAKETGQVFPVHRPNGMKN